MRHEWSRIDEAKKPWNSVKRGRNSSKWGFQNPEDVTNRGRLNAKDLMSILTKAGEGSH
jgi:hypothetical protein